MVHSILLPRTLIEHALVLDEAEVFAGENLAPFILAACILWPSTFLQELEFLIRNI